MRKLLALLAASVIAAAGMPRAEAAVSVDFFYTSLETHGGWIETSDYGYVWQPSEIAEDWRPYTVGSWAYTDAGWTWVSDEPHGWVTHHYGRWILMEPAGWVWVPDTEWAPAWVSWRRSTTHVGWAPLPPEARFERTVGIKTWTDSYYDIGPTNYSFVEVRNIGAPRLVTVVLPPQENITIIRETQNITNIVVQNNIIINEGPKYDVIVRESAQPIRRLRLERQTDIVVDGGQRDNWRGRVEGEVFRVAGPEVQISDDIRPPRVQRKLEKTTVNRGWKGVEQRPEAKELRAKMQKETAQPAGLPPAPKFERMAERAMRQRRPQDSTEIPDDPKKPSGDQPVVGTEGEMMERDRAKRRAGKTDTAEVAAPTTEPDAASPDAGTPNRQKRRMQERERAGTKAEAEANTQDRAKTATEDTTPPANAEKQRDSADKAKMEVNEAAKVDTQAGDAAQADAKTKREAADTVKSDTKTRPNAAEATSTEADTDKNADQQKRRNRQETQTREKAASDAASPAPGADNAATSSKRRSAAERMERTPEAAAPKANERRERPNRAEQPDSPDRPQGVPGANRPNRPDRPQGGQGAPGAERGKGGGGAGREANRERQKADEGNANERRGGAPE